MHAARSTAIGRVRRTSSATAAALALALTAGCGDDDAATPAGTDTGPSATEATDPGVDGDQRHPDVVGVVATYDAGSGTWAFDVTMTSPYDTPERYADGWRVIGPDGTVYGEHTLTHDHANEQPFTRRQRGVAIPDDVVEVTIEGRDQEHGFGGETVTVRLERPG